MSTTIARIKSERGSNVIDVYVSSVSDSITVFVHEEKINVGHKVLLTEETWRELITALEVAGNHKGWEQ